MHRRLFEGKMMRNAILGGLIAAATFPAAAGDRTQIEARYSSDYKGCLKSGDAAQGATVAILSCIGAENERQDGRLNETYRTVMQRLTSPQKGALRQSERAWIGRREAQCRDASNAGGGGTASAIVFNSCFLDGTIRRTLWLEMYRP